MFCFAHDEERSSHLKVNVKLWLYCEQVLPGGQGEDARDEGELSAAGGARLAHRQRLPAPARRQQDHALRRQTHEM